MHFDQATNVAIYRTQRYQYHEGMISFTQDNGETEAGFFFGVHDDGRLGVSMASHNHGRLRYLWSAGHDTDVWYHIAGTYDGATMRLYINGVAVATDTTHSGDIRYLESHLTIGAYRDANQLLYYKGTLDDVRIYDGVLSQTDINAIVAEVNASPFSDCDSYSHYLISTDQGCIPQPICLPGQYVDVAPTIISPRTCMHCAINTVSNIVNAPVCVSPVSSTFFWSLDEGAGSRVADAGSSELHGSLTHTVGLCVCVRALCCASVGAVCAAVFQCDGMAWVGGKEAVVAIRICIAAYELQYSDVAVIAIHSKQCVIFSTHSVANILS